MELLVIRHGQSEADLLGVHEGRADYPLTALGERQAFKMAEYIYKHFPPDVILTSPLIRARRTAFILQDIVGCECVEEQDLMEYNNGILAGLKKDEALVKFPIPKGGRPAHIPIQDGESELQFRYRAEAVFSKIVTEYSGLNRVAIVSHGGLISNFIKAFLKQPINSEFVFPTGDTGFHLLQIKDNSRVVRFMNRQEHLGERDLG
ncbi:histidine phosphatase family protein [Cytobacillus sp. FJAT-54145]|uniref:Histidine phosphatase family protein n=1 Tax=Cytobacillus spartinae TaxID=3299023 RepID=A0ABW6K8X4_9BACI